jgi:hypothetical protein
MTATIGGGDDFGEEFWEAYDGEDEEDEEAESADEAESEHDGQDTDADSFCFEYRWPIDYW